MGAAIEYLQWHFGFFVIRLPREKMHNLTIAIGLVLCMGAGALTVYTDTILIKETKSVRLFRAVRSAKRKTKEYLIDLWN